MIKFEEKRTKFGNPATAVAKGVRMSNMQIGGGIASQAKLLAPVDFGQLRNSISASNKDETILLNNMQGEQAEGLKTDGLKGDEVYVGSNSDHTVYQEYGTIKQPAQPFLRPAMESVIMRKEPAEIYEKYGRQAMEAELKKRKEVR